MRATNASQTLPLAHAHTHAHPPRHRSPIERHRTLRAGSASRKRRRLDFGSNGARTTSPARVFDKNTDAQLVTERNASDAYALTSGETFHES